MPTSEKYECTLDKASLKKAEKELNEDPKERASAVESLRQWIEQNSAWLKSPTDTRFLLMFLRNAKFVQLAARKRLVNYWSGRTTTKEWFENVDTLDTRMEETLRIGNFFPLPRRDKQGRVVFFGRPGSIDVSGSTTVDEVLKASCSGIDYCLMDENAQVNGFVFFQDMSDMTVKHQSFFGVNTLRKFMKIWIRNMQMNLFPQPISSFQPPMIMFMSGHNKESFVRNYEKAYPARYKSVHYYNTNPVFDAIFAIIRPLMPEKLQQRLNFHGKNLSEVYKHIDQECLPSEYLPDDFKGNNVGSLQQCQDDFIRKMQQPEVRDYLLRLSTSGFGVNEDLKPSDDELFNESFRKLNVD